MAWLTAIEASVTGAERNVTLILSHGRSLGRVPQGFYGLIVPLLDTNFKWHFFDGTAANVEGRYAFRPVCRK